MKEKKVKAEKTEKKGQSRVLKFIKEEHSFENILLLVLAIVLLVLGVYILVSAASDNNTFADEYFDISKSGWGIFDASWKVITISSIIVALSAGVIIYCLWPIFTPSVRDLKLVTWTNKKTLFMNSLIVLVFIVFLTLLFYAFDYLLIPLFNLIFGE